MTGAQNRHPRAGYGTGARYGYGYGSYPYYPYYYPYYGYSGYPWYYPAIGLGFSYYGGGGGYGYSEAPQYYDNQSIAPGGYGEYPEGAPPEAGQQPREDQAPGDEMGPPAGPMGEALLSVRPDDASVYIDGEFRGTARELARLPLPLGRHHFEVVRPGFRTAELDVDVRADAPARVNIDLQR